jgi:acetyltransferase-like isoleucine patch superfamily enzyme
MEVSEAPNVFYWPHKEVHSGYIFLDKGEIYIAHDCSIDLTGDVSIGENSMIGHGTQIFTHDHYHEGREPLLEVQKKKGVKWQNKKIGKDVWLHGCIVLYQVTEIPDGVVVGAGAVLTHNPEPYGIYIGNPAKLLKYR